jgi:predicted ester cyclase
MFSRRMFIVAAAAASACSVRKLEQGEKISMSEQDNNIKAIKTYNDAFNRGDIDTAIQSFAEPTRNHGRVVPRAGVARVLQDIRTRFPDVNLSIEQIVAAGDQVIVLQTYSGTHRGVGQLPVDGGLLVGVAPTGKHFSVQHIHWYTLKDGLIVDHRANRDDVGMMVQLGLIVPPAIPERPSV